MTQNAGQRRPPQRFTSCRTIATISSSTRAGSTTTTPTPPSNRSRRDSKAGCNPVPTPAKRAIADTGGCWGARRSSRAATRESAAPSPSLSPAKGPTSPSTICRPNSPLLDSEGSRLTLLPGDLSDEQSCRRIVRDAVRALDGLDTLVLNAGTQHAVKEIAHLSTEQLEYTFATNVFSLFWSVQEALPHMEAGASIITTSSIQAFQPSSFLTDYAASKSAVVGFTRSLAKQLAPKGIRVNSVAPGPVWTPLQVSGAQQPENIPGFGSRTPLGRAGQPVEVAPSYVFLASEESSYITAQIIGVTGGRYIL